MADPLVQHAVREVRVALDAIDGTRVYDLAPYFDEMGPRGEIRELAWPGQVLTDYWRVQ